MNRDQFIQQLRERDGYVFRGCPNCRQPARTSDFLAPGQPPSCPTCGFQALGGIEAFRPVLLTRTRGRQVKNEAVAEAIESMSPRAYRLRTCPRCKRVMAAGKLLYITHDAKGVRIQNPYRKCPHCGLTGPTSAFSWLGDLT